MNSAISIENLSKQYRLGVIGTGTLTHDLKRWWANVLGKEDPTLKIGMENKLTEAGGEYVWALQDINLEVERGEILGVIGKNGAGKSTLLKILSRVTSPTKGMIRMNGKVASLLEVGTGFHPELTGRENVFLNGAILGMTRTEIKSKFNEIAEFAGVEKYIDTPVKRYSSGMYVRLAFAVAAHLEPEILVVDEVLAVGDAEFQRKALGKMQDVRDREGRTILFVSHNMTAIQSLCNNSILLQAGMLNFYGKTDEVINKYLSLSKSDQTGKEWIENEMPGNSYIKVIAVNVKPLNEEIKNIDVGTSFKIIIDFRNLIPEMNINISIVLKNLKGEKIFNVFTAPKMLKAGIYRAVLYVPGDLLNDDNYTFDTYFIKGASKALFILRDPVNFEIHDTLRENTSWYGKWVGVVRPKLNWDYDEIESFS